MNQYMLESFNNRIFRVNTFDGLRTNLGSIPSSRFSDQKKITAPANLSSLNSFNRPSLNTGSTFPPKGLGIKLDKVALFTTGLMGLLNSPGYCSGHELFGQAASMFDSTLNSLVTMAGAHPYISAAIGLGAASLAFSCRIPRWVSYPLVGAGVYALGSTVGWVPILAFGGISLATHMGRMASRGLMDRSNQPVRLYEENPWLRPDFLGNTDGDVPASFRDEIAGRVREFSTAAFNLLDKAGRGNLGRIQREIDFLADPLRHKTVKEVYSALFLMGLYIWQRGVSMIEIGNLPGTTMQFNLMFLLANIAGTALLAIGEAPSRWSTAAGFLDVTAKGLQRNGEYYETTPESKWEAAGFHPNDPEHLTFDNDSPASTTVRYAAFEVGLPEDVHQPFVREILGAQNQPGNIFESNPFSTTLGMLGRACFAAFLLENRNQTQIFGAGGAPTGWAKEMNSIGDYREIVDQVMVWIENLRDTVRTARSGFGTRPVAGEFQRLRTSLEGVIHQYQNQQEIFSRLSYEKTIRGMPNGKLDEVFSEQWRGHVTRLQRMVEMVNGWEASLSPDSTKLDNIDRMYSYLDHRFSHDIIFIPKYWYRHIEMGVFSRVRQDLISNLSANGLNFDNALTQADATAIVDEVRSQVSTHYNRNLNTAVSPARIDDLTNHCLANNLTAMEFANMLMFEASIRAHFVGISKSGLQSGVYSRLGSTRIVAATNVIGEPVLAHENSRDENRDFFNNMTCFHNGRGRLLEFDKGDWMQISDSWLNGSERHQFNNHLSTVAARLRSRGINPNTTLTLSEANEAFEAVVDTTNLRGQYAASAVARRKLRILERMQRNFVEDGNSVSEFVIQALIMAVSSREIEWIDWPDPQFVASMDKDYVYRSINPATGEPDDVLRLGISRYNRWTKEDGRVNISVIQFIQKYAYFQRDGSLAREGIDYPAGTQFREGQRVSFPTLSGRELRIVNGTPRLYINQDLEPVAKDADTDQQTWYGSMLFAWDGFFRDRLNRMSGRANVTGLSYLQDTLGRKSSLYRQYYSGTINDVVDQVSEEMGARINGPLTHQLGAEIISRAKDHLGRAVVGSGIMVGRAADKSFFNCGTCRLEIVPGILSGFSNPYIVDRNGTGGLGNIIGQLDLLMNPASGETQMTGYTPRRMQERKLGTDDPRDVRHMVNQNHDLEDPR